MELGKQAFCARRCAKQNRRCQHFVEFIIMFLKCFLVALGPISMTFDALETGLKFIDFHSYRGGLKYPPGLSAACSCMAPHLILSRCGGGPCGVFVVCALVVGVGEKGGPL